MSELERVFAEVAARGRTAIARAATAERPVAPAALRSIGPKGAGLRVLKMAARARRMNRTVRVQSLDEQSELDEHARRSLAVHATRAHFIGIVRRACLAHVVIVGQDHGRPVLTEYLA